MKRKFTKAYLNNLINNEVEEGLYLDFKNPDALKNKEEITKDVSAFANSDGGIIIYGIEEKKQSSDKFIATKILPTNSNNYIEKDKLEDWINTIKPNIDGVQIHTIKYSAFSVVYIVEIPKGQTAHQANDKKYYRRYITRNLPMEDYAIRELMNRQIHPILDLNIKWVYNLQNSDYPYYLNIVAKNSSQVFNRYSQIELSLPVEFVTEIKSNNALLINNKHYWNFAFQNTDKEIINERPNGFQTKKFYNTRYVPILPKMTFHFGTIGFTKIIDVINVPFYISVYADNSPLKQYECIIETPNSSFIKINETNF